MIGWFDRRKDKIRLTVESAFSHVGQIATIVAAGGREVTREVGEWVTDVFEIREAAGAPEPTWDGTARSVAKPSRRPFRYGRPTRERTSSGGRCADPERTGIPVAGRSAATLGGSAPGRPAGARPRPATRKATREMRNRPSRGRLSAALTSGLALATLCLAIAIPAAASARVAVGVSDGGYTFMTDPTFRKLNAPVVRDIVPWNVAMRHDQTAVKRIGVWLAWAKIDHATPLISFGGYSNTDVPSTSQYKTAVQRFLKDFPSVHNYTAWNEPDWIYRSLSRKPAQAAAYFNTLQSLCRRCTVAAGDAYLPVPHLGSWLSQYVRALHYHPKAWALHPYDDVRGHSTAQLRTLMHYTRAPIWLDEISGVEARGHWHFPSKQSAAAAGRDEKFLFSLAKRYHQITAIYHYQWRASAVQHWDSGLLDPHGRPRPAFSVFANAVRGKLP